MTAAAIEEGLKRLPELAGAEIRAVPYAFDPSTYTVDGSCAVPSAFVGT